MDPLSVGVGGGVAGVLVALVLGFLLRWKPGKAEPAVQVTQTHDASNTGQHAAIVQPLGCAAHPEIVRRLDAISSRQDKVDEKLELIWTVSVRMDERFKLGAIALSGSGKGRRG